MDKYKVKNRRFPRDFRKVANYIMENKGIKVVLGDGTDYLGPFTREIVIHHNYDLRHNGLYILLFECGKALTSYNNLNQIDKETHPQEYNYRQYHIDYEAWEIAYGLITMLKLDVDYQELYKFKYHHLTKYFSEKVC